MEIGLGDEDYEYFSTASTVLILVLVEIGLGEDSIPAFIDGEPSLNPCFSGNRFGSSKQKVVRN